MLAEGMPGLFGAAIQGFVELRIGPQACVVEVRREHCIAGLHSVVNSL